MFLTDGPDAAEQVYVFAHGAGGAMDTPFMTTVARELGERGIRVVRFEFPYMAARRTGGKRGAPDREPVLLNTWREVVAQLGGGPRLFIGGKSMGGRMATLVADELKVRGAVVFGYPFHPPGQPNKLRTAHLGSMTTPMLVLQGERDVFGSRDDVAGYQLSPQIRVEWIPDGDHSLKPRAKSGTTERQNLLHAIDAAAKFMSSR
ncbi:MAG: alpha/beta fold hydrolase [Acidobacteria bacterium]|nr:alpha/beta fold hydrolase [Acidobacteriota bacterium]MBV9069328.1 alpha/beta fold hydrolase [Acidobacteriota bacterium]MBV9188356.1 alpha/beta fold hydrolase [Acidobacteriota bacterium]